jgi:hypothetical protein
MAPHLRWSVCLSQHNPRWRGIVKQMSFTRAFYGPISRFTNRHNSILFETRSRLQQKME